MHDWLNMLSRGEEKKERRGQEKRGEERRGQYEKGQELVTA